MDKGRINFVQQVIWFCEYAKRNHLSAYERAFWLGLFWLANRLAILNPERDWPVTFFPVGNHELKAATGLEERSIRTLRHQMKIRGLLDYRKGNGKAADPEYKIHYFRPTAGGFEPESDWNGYKNAADEDGNGCKNVPDADGTGYKNVPDAETEEMNAAGTGCKYVPDETPKPLINQAPAGSLKKDIKDDDEYNEYIPVSSSSEGVQGEPAAPEEPAGRRADGTAARERTEMDREAAMIEPAVRKMVAEGYEESEVREVAGKIVDIGTIRNVYKYLKSSVEYNRRRRKAVDTAVSARANGYMQRDPGEYEQTESPEEMLERLRSEMFTGGAFRSPPTYPPSGKK